MSSRTFTVRVDSTVVEEAARSFKCSPEKFVAGAVATAILDELDGGEVHVTCNGQGWAMSSTTEGDAA